MSVPSPMPIRRLVLVLLLAGTGACTDAPVASSAVGCQGVCHDDFECSGDLICLEQPGGSKRCLPSSCGDCTSLDLSCEVDAACGSSECKPRDCGASCTSTSQCAPGIACLVGSDGAETCQPEQCETCLRDGIHCDFGASSCTFAACRKLDCGERCTSDAQCSGEARCVAGPAGTSACLPPGCKACSDLGLRCAPDAACGNFSCKKLQCKETCTRDDQCEDGVGCRDDGTGTLRCLPAQCADCAATGLACGVDSATCAFKECTRRRCGEACTSSAQCGNGAACVKNFAGTLMCLPPQCPTCYSQAHPTTCDFMAATCAFTGCTCPEGTVRDEASGECIGSCGSATPYVVCSNGSMCPPQSTCTDNNTRCTCAAGRTSQLCDGTPCANCPWEWRCAACVPNCSGKVCGDDGCGGSCGTCSAGATCSAGRCVTTCAPSCGGKNCGSDGCGGSCGTCSAGYSCTNGQCTTSGGTCHSRNDCVEMRVTHPTGAGNCSGEIVGRFQNNCGESVKCRYCVLDGGRLSDCGESDPVPVGSSGGEMGGIWSCGKSASSVYQYSCAARSDPYSCISF